MALITANDGVNDPNSAAVLDVAIYFCRPNVCRPNDCRPAPYVRFWVSVTRCLLVCLLGTIKHICLCRCKIKEIIRSATSYLYDSFRDNVVRTARHKIDQLTGLEPSLCSSYAVLLPSSFSLVLIETILDLCVTLKHCFSK